MTAGLGGVGVSPALAGETARLAVGFVAGDAAAPAAALARGILRMMAIGKVKAGVMAVALLAGVVWQLPVQPDVRAAPVPAPPKEAPKEAKLRPGDLLDLRIVPQWEKHPVNGLHAVSPTGHLALGPDYGGPVKVEGLTPREAAAVIQKQVGKFLKNPEVELARHAPDGPAALQQRIRLLEEDNKALRARVEGWRSRSRSSSGR